MYLLENLSKKAFWDVDISQLDAEQHADFIIEKVYEHGKWNDILLVTNYYGDERVKATLQNAPFFFPDTISFISTIFNINKEEMKCFTSRPYHPNVFI